MPRDRQAAAIRQLMGLAGPDVAELSDDIARSAADLLHSAATVLEPSFRDPVSGRLIAGAGPVTEAARSTTGRSGSRTRGRFGSPEVEPISGWERSGWGW